MTLNRSILSLALGLGLPCAAHAGWFDSAPEWKQYATKDGCLVNISYKNHFDVSYAWSETCRAGQGITGKGTLRQISSGGDCAEFLGEMVNGYWVGSVHRNLYDASCSGKLYDARNFNFPLPEPALLGRPEPEPEPAPEPEPPQVLSNDDVEVKLTNDLGDGCKQIQIFNKSGKFLTFRFVYVYEFSNGKSWQKLEEAPAGGGVRSRSTVGLYLHPGPPGNVCKDGYQFKLEDFGYRLE